MKQVDCRVCKQPISDPFMRMWGKCETCAREECKKGNHTWDPVVIGLGVANFCCLFCDATSDGSLEPLKQLGLRQAYRRVVSK